jgi:hypothetical protein
MSDHQNQRVREDAGAGENDRRAPARSSHIERRQQARRREALMQRETLRQLRELGGQASFR